MRLPQQRGHVRSRGCGGHRARPGAEGRQSVTCIAGCRRQGYVSLSPRGIGPGPRALCDQPRWQRAQVADDPGCSHVGNGQRPGGEPGAGRSQHRSYLWSEPGPAGQPARECLHRARGSSSCRARRQTGERIARCHFADRSRRGFQRRRPARHRQRSEHHGCDRLRFRSVRRYDSPSRRGRSHRRPARAHAQRARVSPRSVVRAADRRSAQPGATPRHRYSSQSDSEGVRGHSASHRHPDRAAGPADQRFPDFGLRRRIT